MAKGKPKKWTDRDMDLLFSFTPTTANSKIVAELLGRSASSVKTAWAYSKGTKKYNLKHWSKGGFPERLRKARVRNGWVG